MTEKKTKVAKLIKVGDKVRIINNAVTQHLYPIGDIHTISTITGAGISTNYRTIESFNNWNFRISEVEFVEKTKKDIFDELGKLTLKTKKLKESLKWMEENKFDKFDDEQFEKHFALKILSSRISKAEKLEQIENLFQQRGK